MTDELTLIAALQNSKTKEVAFKQLLSLYKERLYWHIRKIVVSHDDADDVLQNNMIVISKEWIKEVAIILGKELKKKTVGEMFKTVQIFFNSHLDKRLYHRDNLENFYILALVLHY